MIYILLARGETTSLGNLRQKLNVHGKDEIKKFIIPYLDRHKIVLSVIILVQNFKYPTIVMDALLSCLFYYFYFMALLSEF